MTFSREITLSLLSNARRLPGLVETFIGHTYGDNGEIIATIARKIGDNLYELTECGPNAGR
jgi:hypothetical protein